MSAIDTDKKTVAAQGVGGVRYDWDNKPNVEWNTEVLLRDFMGDHYTIGIADKMQADPTIARVLNMLRYPLLGAKAIIQPASEQPKDLEIAEALRVAMFQKQNHTRWLRHAFLSFVYGFVPFAYEEIVTPSLGKLKGPFTVLAPQPRSAPTIQSFERQGDRFVSMRQFAEAVNVTIPLADCMIVTYDERFGNIAGRANMRDLYACYRNKLKIIIMAMIKLQRAGGVPILEGYNPSVDKTAVQTLLSKFMANEIAYLAIPDSWGKIQLANGGQNDQGDHLKWINYWDSQAVGVILGDFMERGKSGTSGSYNTADVQYRMYKLALGHFETVLEDPWNHDSQASVCEGYIKRFVLDNYGPQYELPRYNLSVQEVDVATTGAIVDVLAKLGTLNEDDQRRARQELDYTSAAIEKDMDDKEKQADAVTKKEADESIEIVGPQEAEPTKTKNNAHGSNCACCNTGNVKFGAFDSDLKLWRQPRASERYVALSEINSTYNVIGRKISAALRDYYMDTAELYAKRIAKLVAKDDIGGINKFKVSDEDKANTFDAIDDDVFDAYAFGRKTVRDEVTAQRHEAQAKKPRAFKTSRDDADFGDPGSDYEDLVAEGSVERAILDLSLNEQWGTIEETLRRSALRELRLGKDAGAIIADVLALSSGQFDKIGGFAVSFAINAGREDQAIVYADEIKRGEYSAILDKSTCDTCRRADGTTWPFEGKANPAYARTPNPYCLGGESRCRCITVYALVSEAEPEK